MNLKKLGLTSGVLVVLAVAVMAFNWSRNTPSQGQRVGQPLLGALDMSQAASINIRTLDKEVTLLATDEGGWIVKEQSGFPADVQKLSTLLLNINAEKASHLLTRRKEKLAELGLLTEVENDGKREKDKTASVFSIVDKEGKPLYQLLFGKDRRNSNGSFGGQYIRFGDEMAAYLVGKSLFVDKDSKDWLDRVIFSVTAKDTMQRIQVSAPGQADVTLSRGKKEDPWSLEGAGAASFKQSAAVSLANMIGGLDMSGAVKAAGADGKTADAKKYGRTRTGKVLVDFFDKRRYTITVGTEKAEGDLRYATFSAELDPAATDEKLKTEVADFNAKYQGYLLALYEWDGNQLIKPRKEYLESDKKK